MKIIIDDSVGIKTGISITNVGTIVSHEKDFLRVCGNVESNPNNNLFSLAPITVVCELLDKSSHILDTEIWQPINNRFHGFSTFKIVFQDISSKNEWKNINSIKVYLSYC